MCCAVLCTALCCTWCCAEHCYAVRCYAVLCCAVLCVAVCCWSRAPTGACSCPLTCPSRPILISPPTPPLVPVAGELLNANANLVLQLARPFAADPTIDNLIGIRPGQTVG